MIFIGLIKNLSKTGLLHRHLGQAGGMFLRGFDHVL